MEENIRTFEDSDNVKRLLDRCPIAMAVQEKDGKFVYLNNKFLETFGYTMEDIPTVDDWWPRAYPDVEYRRKVIDSWGAAAKKAIEDRKETAAHEWRVTCKDGTLRDIEFRMA